MSAASRHPAQEPRDEIVAAASIEFAETGYAGTSTDAIARRSGVSQPYLFQLFGTKKDLFIAAVRDCFDRTEEAFAGGRPSTGTDPRGDGPRLRPAAPRRPRHSQTPTPGLRSLRGSGHPDSRS